MTTGLDSLDTTVQKTNIWLKEIMDEMGTNDRQMAYLALRAVLQTLRDRLTVDEATDLGAQLPMLIRGIYYEGWEPSGKPLRIRSKEELLDCIRAYFPRQPDIDAESVARAVYRVISRRISEGELGDIIGSLPQELRMMWASC